MGKIRERWRPSGIITIAVISLFGLGVIAIAVIAMVTELWGQPLFDTTGVARPKPVWMAWIGAVVAILGGASLFLTGTGYLIRVARGLVPRVPPTREDKEARRLRRKREYDSRKRARLAARDRVAQAPLQDDRGPSAD